jgi:hypothetical protein
MSIKQKRKRTLSANLHRRWFANRISVLFRKEPHSRCVGDVRNTMRCAKEAISDSFTPRREAGTGFWLREALHHPWNILMGQQQAFRGEHVSEDSSDRTLAYYAPLATRPTNGQSL